VKYYLRALKQVFVNYITLSSILLDFTYYLGKYYVTYEPNKQVMLYIIGLGIIVSSIYTMGKLLLRLEVLESDLPSVDITLDNIPGTPEGRGLYIINSSSRRLHNIQFEPIDSGGESNLFQIHSLLTGTNSLVPNEKRLVKTTYGAPNADDELDRKILVASLDPKYSSSTFVLTINYLDNNNTKYKMLYLLGKGGIKQHGLIEIIHT